ncbi:MAG: capsular biosynthesis protein, partial [Firmicutes bacterium]|nr:capsular biosynthesis protein [Bacillota bacterium]
ARLAELQATGDVRFISPAVAPRSPSSPNHKLNIAIAIVLAGMIGVGVVFLSNMLRTPVSYE